MQQQQTYQMPNFYQTMSGGNPFVNQPGCPTCGRVHAPPPAATAGINPTASVNPAAAMTAAATDWLNQWNEIPIVKEWNRLWGGMLQPLTQSVPMPAAAAAAPAGQPQPQHTLHRRHGMHKDYCCGCSCCRHDDCHCRCCIVDADLLVYARLGESRVVPLTIENHLRREREVELQLSDWTTHSKEAVKVTAQVGPETKFTLKPCEDRTVSILISAAPATDGRTNDDSSAAAAAGEGEGATATGAPEATAGREADGTPPRSQFPDVSECTVFYADLRVKGCDIRPVRIALAILPRNCDAYKIDCQCGCCC